MLLWRLYQKSIQDNSIAAPLSNATRKGALNKVVTSRVREGILHAEGKKLTIRPILQLLGLSEPFTLSTDLSNIEVGATLCMENFEIFIFILKTSIKTISIWKVNLKIIRWT